MFLNTIACIRYVNLLVPLDSSFSVCIDGDSLKLGVINSDIETFCFYVIFFPSPRPRSESILEGKLRGTRLTRLLHTVYITLSREKILDKTRMYRVLSATQAAHTRAVEINGYVRS